MLSEPAAREDDREEIEVLKVTDEAHRDEVYGPASATRSASVQQRHGFTEEDMSRDRRPARESSGPDLAEHSARATPRRRRRYRESGLADIDSKDPAKAMTGQFAKSPRQDVNDEHPKVVKDSGSASESRMAYTDVTIDNIDEWRKADLVNECKRRHLRITGNKKDLRDRLLDDFRRVIPAFTAAGAAADPEQTKPKSDSETKDGPSASIFDQRGIQAPGWEAGNPREDCPETVVPSQNGILLERDIHADHNKADAFCATGGEGQEPRPPMGSQTASGMLERNTTAPMEVDDALGSQGIENHVVDAVTDREDFESASRLVAQANRGTAELTSAANIKDTKHPLFAETKGNSDDESSAREDLSLEKGQLLEHNDTVLAAGLFVRESICEAPRDSGGSQPPIQDISASPMVAEGSIGEVLPKGCHGSAHGIVPQKDASAAIFTLSPPSTGNQQPADGDNGGDVEDAAADGARDDVGSMRKNIDASTFSESPLPSPRPWKSTTERGDEGSAEAPRLAGRSALTQADGSARRDERSSLDDANQGHDQEAGSWHEAERRFDDFVTSPLENAGHFHEEVITGEDQRLHIQASADLGGTSGLFPDPVMVGGEPIIDNEAEEAQAVQVPDASSADELSSDENGIGLDGDESGGIGDPVDEAAESNGSSSAGEADAHSQDSRSSQGSLPIAESDKSSAGGSWSSAHPSCPSPRSGISSGHDNGENPMSGQVTGSAVDDRRSSLPPLGEIANLSDDDGLLCAGGRLSTERAGAANAGPGSEPRGMCRAGTGSGIMTSGLNLSRSVPKGTLNQNSVRDEEPGPTANIAALVEKNEQDHHESNGTHYHDSKNRALNSSAMPFIKERQTGDITEGNDRKGRVGLSATLPVSAGLLPPKLMTRRRDELSGPRIPDRPGTMDEVQGDAQPARSQSLTSIPKRHFQALSPCKLREGGNIGFARADSAGSVLGDVVKPACEQTIRGTYDHNNDRGAHREQTKTVDGLPSTSRASPGPFASIENAGIDTQGPAASLSPPVKRQRVSSLYASVNQMPSPALTMKKLEPLLPVLGASHDHNRSISRALQFRSPMSSKPSSLMQRLMRIEENRASCSFPTFRDTIRDRIEKESQPFSTNRGTGAMFHVGSSGTRKDNLSRAGQQRRAKLRTVRARRAWDSKELAAESLRHTMDMTQQLNAWKNAAAPFALERKPNLGATSLSDDMGIASSARDHDREAMPKRRRT